MIISPGPLKEQFKSVFLDETIMAQSGQAFGRQMIRLRPASRDHHPRNRTQVVVFYSTFPMKNYSRHIKTY